MRKRLLSGLLLGLAGCAQLPHDLPARPAMKTPTASATIEALGASLTQDGGKALSTAPWWQAFGRPDLDRLVETALRDHPDWTMAQARLRKADEAERLARLDAQVHYATDATMVREHLSRNGLFPPPIGGSTFTQTDLTQNLSYSLDWWGKNRSLVQAAGNERQAARDEAAAVRLSVAAAVADAFRASRLGRLGGSFGTLPGADFDAIVRRAWPG